MKSLPHPVTLSVLGALALVTSVAYARTSPLATWMRSNMGSAKASEDYVSLQKNFTFLSEKAPSRAYSQWAKIAKSGAAAAAKQDMGAIKAACDDCHSNYKRKYRQEFGGRAFP